MDESRFDRWTRRHWGHVMAGAAGALFGYDALDHAAATRSKRRKRRKRCLKLGAGCRPGGKRTCCGALRCDRISIGSPTVTCCKSAEAPCGGDEECCSNHFCEGSPTTCVFYPPPSDRALKANFGSVDPADMLERVRALPISIWNYTSDDPSIRHIGPMAQDFAALFGVGADDRHIHPIDVQGVALSAIQGIAGEIAALRAANATLAVRLAVLETGGEAPA